MEFLAATVFWLMVVDEWHILVFLKDERELGKVHWYPLIVKPSIVDNPSLFIIANLGLTNFDRTSCSYPSIVN